MCATFTEDDVGKTVEDPNGTAIGVVAAVEDDHALVEPDPGAVDSIKAALGWEQEADETVPIAPDSVDVITGEVVRLESDPAPSSPTDEATVTNESDGDADEPVIEQDEETDGQRSAGASGGEADDASEHHVGAGSPQPQVEGEAGADRHEDNEDAPPHGDRTVTRERGEEDDR
ncbi:hypothetical protein [Halopiger aswanensis]|uniref:Uncharacterized protein n=1 Tax=Halopiger aswanensis TaxID=148449 RepID=A0A3R7EEQ8_9EURY|nr:hypothetical protein [Halopiger aswanensis]RKD95004.1 hypothetical protein ATJ93_1853 [Halopiger aswanensis]